MKFNPDRIGDQHTLAVALSDGTLRMLQLDLPSHQWKDDLRLLIDTESTICLSVDWSNQIHPDPTPQVAVSLSNGEMSIVSFREDSLCLLHKWKAHTLPYVHTPAEVWITSFDPNEPSTVFSGGDDGLLKQWDTRMVDAYASPVLVNRDAGAGVTSMCWNKYNSQYMTVGSYDGHVRLYDKRSMTRAVSDLDLENNAGIWRIKYKYNCNFYSDRQHGIDRESALCRDEFLVAAMRAGFVVMNCDQSLRLKKDVEYLKQGGESLAYGVDYVYQSEEDKKEGVAASCSFYNHMMHVWDYKYCGVCYCHSILIKR